MKQPYSPLITQKMQSKASIIDPIIRNSQSFTINKVDESARDLISTKIFIDKNINKYKVSPMKVFNNPYFAKNSRNN